MLTYLKMKKNEWKVKAMFYGMIIGVVDNQRDIIELAKNLYAALKDASVEDLRSEFVENLAAIIHENNQNAE